MSTLIAFVVCFIVHELGHYVAYLAFGQQPKIKLLPNFMGIYLESKKEHELKIWQFFIIIASGVIIGWIPAFFISHSQYLFIAYLLICVADLTNLLIVLPRQNPFKTIKEEEIREALEILKKYKVSPKPDEVFTKVKSTPVLGMASSGGKDTKKEVKRC